MRLLIANCKNIRMRVRVRVHIFSENLLQSPGFLYKMTEKVIVKQV